MVPLQPVAAYPDPDLVAFRPERGGQAGVRVSLRLCCVKRARLPERYIVYIGDEALLCV